MQQSSSRWLVHTSMTDPASLAALIEEHPDDIDAWHTWRSQAETIIDIDLVGANLSGAYLGEADLVGANLHGADLSGAHLDKADLSWSMTGFPNHASFIRGPMCTLTSRHPR